VYYGRNKSGACRLPRLIPVWERFGPEPSKQKIGFLVKERPQISQVRHPFFILEADAGGRGGVGQTEIVQHMKSFFDAIDKIKTQEKLRKRVEMSLFLTSRGLRENWKNWGPKTGLENYFVNGIDEKIL
jgi:hypothetical protein